MRWASTSSRCRSRCAASAPRTSATRSTACPSATAPITTYNGLTISRALISENLGRADLATGIAGLGIASTSNLGGALTYTSSDPHRELGLAISQTVGSEDSLRTFVRLDTGEHGRFSAYVSGQYSQQDLFVNQRAWNKSTGKQFNGKLKYEFDGGAITAFGDVSRTNQADDPYLSKDMRNRLGWDWGGYAPDWQSYLGVAYCGVTGPTAPTKCVPRRRRKRTPTSPSPTVRSCATTNSSTSLGITASPIPERTRPSVSPYRQGRGNNWITGWSTQGTPSTADDLPVQIRDTRYTIDRTGGLASLSWNVGFNHFQAGLWLEDNTSSAARYIWTNVTGPFNLGHFLKGQPDSAQWGAGDQMETRQFYVQDTVTLLVDALSFDFGSRAPTRSRMPRPSAVSPRRRRRPSSQFATGTLGPRITSCRRWAYAGRSRPNTNCSRATPRTWRCSRWPSNSVRSR